MGRKWVRSERGSRSECSGLVQQLLEVSHSMHNSDDLKGPSFRAIDNDVIGIARNSPEADRLSSNFSALGPKQRMPSQPVAG